MFRNRFLILLGTFFLAVSAAWADDMGYVDCSNHPDDTQVFAKARRTPEALTSVHCGERFTVLVYGFVFSRIQTKDGNVGYIYSNLIAVDRAATSAQQTPSAQLATAKVKVPSSSPAVAHPAPAASMQPQPAPAQPALAPAPAPPSPLTSKASEAPATVVQPAPPAAGQPQSTPAQPASAPAPGSASPELTSKAPEAPADVMQPAPSAPALPQLTSAQSAPASAPEPAASGLTSKDPETPATVAQPDAPAQPEPARAEPAAPAIRPAETRATWERPLPGGTRRAPLLELFGGYAFARMDGGSGTWTNLSGALGSLGWNVKPWLQVVADTSYSVVTANGVKNVLYGNHYGPRYFRRGHNRWGATPFAEALVGGSRATTTVSGTGGYSSSVNAFSIKVGGGLDIHPSRRFDIRLFDADYYRTSFGTNLHQNNYWVSTGIVLRLFAGRSE